MKRNTMLKILNKANFFKCGAAGRPQTGA